MPKTDVKTKYRVAHFPQVPCKAFHVEVESVEQGLFLMETLWEYDMFQFKNKIKPDYSNATCFQVFEGDEWVDWYNEEGEDASEVLDKRRENK